MKLIKRHQQSSPERLPAADKYFVSACGVGFAPVASGTFGSAFALLFYFFIPGFWHWYILLPCSIIVCILAIPPSSRAEKVYGDDPAMVVIDEVVGMWVSLISPFIAAPLFGHNWLYAVIAFFLFRLFDIVKPYPANKLDAMKGGFGIMMDDVAAGVYANITAHLVLYGLGALSIVYVILK